MNVEKIRLCAVADFTAIPAKGFTVKTGEQALEVFVVQRNGQWYGYRNRCPHTGVNLDWLPDQFLDAGGALILCATHGAQFRIEDGYCVFGPCAGQALTPVAILVEDGMVYLQVGLAGNS